MLPLCNSTQEQPQLALIALCNDAAFRRVVAITLSSKRCRISSTPRCPCSVNASERLSPQFLKASFQKSSLLLIFSRRVLRKLRRTLCHSHCMRDASIYVQSGCMIVSKVTDHLASNKFCLAVIKVYVETYRAFNVRTQIFGHLCQQGIHSLDDSQEHIPF